jgi:hypothetical protein
LLLTIALTVELYVALVPSQTGVTFLFFFLQPTADPIPMPMHRTSMIPEIRLLLFLVVALIVVVFM